MTDKQGVEAPIETQIVDYWSVQPPFKAEQGEPGSLEWSRSIAEHRYRVIPFLRDWADFGAFRGKRVLEIGFGAGTDFCEFARAGAVVNGIDITETAVDLTRKRLRAEGLTGTVQRYDGTRIPFDAGSFDAVYSFGVLHHTPFMDDLFAEVHRVLAPGGRFKMMLYHRQSLLYYYSIVYLRQLKQEGGRTSREAILSRYSEFRTGCPYTRVFTAKEMQERLWFFSDVNVTADYCIYDSEDERKLRGDRTVDVDATGVADVDLFFQQFNAAVRERRDLRPFGWHLLTDAVR
jgi:SAM-dependent methyltransferase